MLFRTQLGLFALGLVIVSTFATTHAAAAELRSSGMISTTGARRAGLERAWASAVRMDGGRDRLVGSTLHITSDPQRERRIIEVHYNNRKEIYTDTDVDRYGEVLGKDGVQKKTIARVNDLKAQNIDAKTVEYNVPEMMFFVASRRGFIHAMDAHTGATRWSARIGNPDHPTHGPAANDKYVAVINGNVLYVLKHDDGELAWQKKLSYVPSAGPALSDDLAFVPSTRGAIESFDLADYKRPVWIYQSQGHAMVRPVTTSRSVIWPTDRGHLYVGRANSAGINYRLEAAEAIIAPATAADRRIFTASSDGYVYCVEETGGAILWRFSTGEPINSSPIPVGENVYVTGTNGGMFCISIADGQEQWWAPGVRRFISASETRLYCQDQTGEMIVLNPKSGARLGIVPMGGVDHIYQNYATDRIFVGSSDGLIVCLHESQLHWPVEHLQDDSAPKVSKPDVVQQGLGDEPNDAGRPAAAADPFGAPPAGAADPFGADPFGAGNNGGGGNNGGNSGGNNNDPFGSDPFGSGAGGNNTDPDSDPFGASPF